MTLKRLTDEELAQLSPGTAVHYGPRMAGSLDEASQLINEALIAMGRGKPLTRRQYALVAWLLGPIGEGERIGNELPHKKGRVGRKPGVTFQAQVRAVAVQSLRNDGLKKDPAIKKVAGKPKVQTSVRGDYERVQKQMGEASLKRYAVATKETAAKLRKMATRK